jgi:hypothetical protein
MGYTYDSVYEDEGDEDDKKYEGYGEEVEDLEGEHLGDEG